MSKIKNKIMVLILAVFALASCFAAAGFPEKAKAEEATCPQDGTFEIVDKVSLKLNEDGGLRWILKASDEIYNYVKGNDNVEMGFVIAPKQLTDKVTDGNYYGMAQKIEIPVVLSKGYRLSDDASNWYFNGCVVEMLEANRELDYTAAAYIKNGDSVERQTAVNENSVNDFYNIANLSMLYSGEDYSEKMLGLSSYDWLGTEKFPIKVDTTEQYNSLVAKINADRDFSAKYIDIKSSVDTSKAALSDGKTLPSGAKCSTFADDAVKTTAPTSDDLIKDLVHLEGDSNKIKVYDQTEPNYVTTTKDGEKITALYFTKANAISEDEDSANNYGFSEFRIAVSGNIAKLSFDYRLIDSNTEKCFSLSDVKDKSYGMKSFLEYKHGSDYTNETKTAYGDTFFKADGLWHHVDFEREMSDMKAVLFKIYHLQGEFMVTNVQAIISHTHISDGITHYDVVNMKEYNLCTECGERMNETEHTHAAKDDNYGSDEGSHWKLCVCGEKVDEAAHTSDGETHYDLTDMKQYNLCKDCGAKINEKTHNHDYQTATEDGYECGCGTVVNPFDGLVKTKTTFYDSTKVSVSENSLFGGTEYVANGLSSGNSIGYGYGVGITSTGYFKEYYFALRVSQDVVMAEATQTPLAKGVWYVVKTTARTDSLGGWDFYVKQPNETEWKSMNVAAWRAGAYKDFNGKAEFTGFLYFATNAEKFDVEISEFYAKETIITESPFDGMDKLNLGYLKDYNAAETFFGDKKYVYNNVVSGTVIGADGVSVDSIGEQAIYKNVYFGVKATDEIAFLDGGSNIIKPAVEANVWSVVKLERKTLGWNLFIKEFGQNDYTQINIDTWKVGDNSSPTINGKAHANVFMQFKSVSGNDFGLEVTELYGELDSERAFSGMTKVQDSSLIDSAAKAAYTFGSENVYGVTGLKTGDGISLGSQYNISSDSNYAEYRFAFKITGEAVNSKNIIPIVSSNGGNTVKADVWYVMKVAKAEDASATKKWIVSVKVAGLDDSTFVTLNVDSWKEQSDTITPSILLMTWWIWENDAFAEYQFDFYATGIWAE